ncbi:MAG TPA: hypothetical protein VE783_01450 [Candidatus Limnocylindrales bacterium]|nr:hypothetical protein [Candidatus Limnocylindrales bacterium]
MVPVILPALESAATPGPDEDELIPEAELAPVGAVEVALPALAGDAVLPEDDVPAGVAFWLAEVEDCAFAAAATASNSGKRKSTAAFRII